LAKRQKNIWFVEIGKKVKKYLINGSYVPDDIMISLIDSEIEALVVNRNYLLDGK